MNWLEGLRQNYKNNPKRSIIGEMNGGHIANYSGSGAYWRTVLLYRLSPQENAGNHHLYIDFLDRDGNVHRNFTYPVQVAWGWENKRPDEVLQPARADKPFNEPACNIPIGRNMYVYATVLDDPSDTAMHINTSYISEGYDLYHYSYYWLLQWWVQGEAPGTTPPTPSPEPPPPSGGIVLPYRPLQVWINGAKVYEGNDNELDIKVVRK